jgi:hypothetical protein
MKSVHSMRLSEKSMRRVGHVQPSNSCTFPDSRVSVQEIALRTLFRSFLEHGTRPARRDFDSFLR